MQIQVAGTNLTNTCGLNETVIERFISFCAANTQSNTKLWYVIQVEDGPAVYTGQSSLVAIVEPDEFGSANVTSSPSPSQTEESTLLYEGSVIFALIAYLRPASVNLAEGSFMDYIMSQRIVYGLQLEGFREIKWTGMLTSPLVMDVRTTGVETSESEGRSISIVRAFAFAGAVIAGILVLLVAVSRGGFSGVVPRRPLLPTVRAAKV